MNELNIGIALPTKENISTAATNIIDLVRSGEVNPLDVAVKLTAIEKACEMIREGISDAVVDELGKSNGKTSYLGAQVDRREVGTKWDYTASEAWNKTKEAETKAAEKRKAVEKIAQNVPEGTETTFTDTDTGETFSIVRGAKSSKTSYAVKLS
jgi:hypothetical protein